MYSVGITEHFEDWYVSDYAVGKFDKLDAAIQAFNDICLSIINESSAREGNSPVSENGMTSWDRHPSTTGHEESCGNLRGPSRKAKY